MTFPAWRTYILGALLMAVAVLGVWGGRRLASGTSSECTAPPPPPATQTTDVVRVVKKADGTTVTTTSRVNKVTPTPPMVSPRRPWTLGLTWPARRTTEWKDAVLVGLAPVGQTPLSVVGTFSPTSTTLTLGLSWSF